MEYMEGMEQIHSDIMDKVLTEMNDYDYNHYTADDVKRGSRQRKLRNRGFQSSAVAGGPAVLRTDGGQSKG